MYHNCLGLLYLDIYRRKKADRFAAFHIDMRRQKKSNHYVTHYYIQGSHVVVSTLPLVFSIFS